MTALLEYLNLLQKKKCRTKIFSYAYKTYFATTTKMRIMVVCLATWAVNLTERKPH